MTTQQVERLIKTLERIADRLDRTMVTPEVIVVVDGELSEDQLHTIRSKVGGDTPRV